MSRNDDRRHGKFRFAHPARHGHDEHSSSHDNSQSHSQSGHDDHGHDG